VLLDAARSGVHAEGHCRGIRTRFKRHVTGCPEVTEELLCVAARHGIAGDPFDTPKMSGRPHRLSRQLRLRA